MFIKRIRLQGFGRLIGTCEFQQNRCNVLCQDNEFGKSTLMDAVLYAFYNFPSTGYKRTDLKPKDRYKPWFADGSGGARGAFCVELELIDTEGRELLLQADFNKQQPFELRDLNTHQIIPMDGTSFGRRYFRMPIQSFTECFFFRQDEREGPGRDDLIRVIEEAAASNQRQQPSSVRQAISALAEARLHLPEFSADAIQVETLLKRIDEKAASVRVKLHELTSDREHRNSEIVAAEQMDHQVHHLEQQAARLELALLRTEIVELESVLSRQADLANARSQREKAIAELQPFSAFVPASRSRVEELHSDLRGEEQRRAGLKSHLDGTLKPEMEVTEGALGELPDELADLDASDLEQIREQKSVLVERRRHAADEDRRVADLQEQLRQSGVPIEEVEEVLPRLDALPEVDRRCLLDPDGKRTAAEAALSDIERRSAEARTLVTQAKARRGQFGTYAGAAAAGAASLLAMGVVLLLTRYTLAGSALLTIAVLGGAVSLWQLTKRREHVVRTELEPATAQEVTLNGEAQRLREQVEDLETELATCMERQGLTEDDLAQFRAVAQWLQAAVPYRAALMAQQRTREELEQVLSQAAETLSRVPAYGAADSDEEQLDQLAADLTRHLELRAKRTQLSQDLANQEREIAELENTIFSRRDELVAQILPSLKATLTGTVDQPLAELVSAYSNGCEKAIKLQATLDQPEPEKPLPQDENQAVADRCTELRAQWDALETLPENLPPGDRNHLQHELSRVERDREELRVRRINAFNEADRAVELWRREGPQLKEELDRLNGLRAEVERYGEAVRMAHQQLSDISDEVFRQWATGINERVNEILPLLNARYRDVKCSNQLEISAYSTEAGRRLDSRELQHLSKGARDQLQLSVRIAVSEYLSAHVGHLPLVFDEPFAHWDDRRFIDGMRFLADLSQRHQVILLSCHHWRYDQLQSQEPELANRLHFCNLCDDKLLV